LDRKRFSIVVLLQLGIDDSGFVATQSRNRMQQADRDAVAFCMTKEAVI
jgi:hypothetical protein